MTTATPPYGNAADSPEAGAAAQDVLPFVRLRD